MLHFKRLRLSGFKSFVEPTDLSIDMGLTGIVGPNGCGKSNLVEALKWVMGETSAKQMRGGDMDDVIFSGTSNRPARNIAEVVLTLDNGTHGAPAPFTEADDLEIARRIEREKGSLYKINGQDVRARDVQLLFADQATGSRSTALVSQGRIGAVIGAKPTERRTLLEEAAGIRGLHSRRHEAELRLRAAEGNLSRLDDILVTLDAQMQSLKKQARQAVRYRNLSDLIRTAEATLFYLRWTDAEATLERQRQILAEVEAEVNRASVVVGSAATEQAEAAAAVPELRDAEAATAAVLQRLTIAREGLDDEERRIQAAQADTQRRIEETVADTAREDTLIADALAAIERLNGEHADIEKAREGEGETLAAAAADLETAENAVTEHENVLSELTERVANAEARRTALNRRAGELADRRERLAKRAADLAAERERLEADAPEAEAMADAEREVAKGTLEIENAQSALANAETARQTAEQAREDTRRAADDARTAATKLEAEAGALAKLLDSGGPDMWPSLIDAVSVEPGFETAFGAALGDEIEASDDEAAPVHWRTLPPLMDAPALPFGAEPLSSRVTAPASLARRLSQIGIVASADMARQLLPSLRPGQRLVTRDGGLWRWDGYSVNEGAPTAAARRLEQRNRLREIDGQLESARARHRDAAATAEEARLALEARVADERAERDALREAEQAANRARQQLAAITAKLAAHGSRLAAVTEQIDSVQADIAEADERIAETAAEQAALPDVEGDRARIVTLREELNERRSRLIDARSRADNIERLARERRQRLSDIDRERQSWGDRHGNAAKRREELVERRAMLDAERDALAKKPAELQEKRHALLNEIETAERNRRAAADALQTAETRLAAADKALRAAEAELAKHREARVRHEGGVEQAVQTCHAIAERIDDRLECRPDQLFEIAGLEADKPLPELEATERKVERLQRERETMGPVNLRAEQEMTELTTQIETLTLERDDLIQAIEKLRRGISELNREGRQRLLASFEEVNTHFAELFTKLFGGGHAHLALTESDDPLEAGLEIMASPPGKKLQSLTLLSGGEQALTALSLLFAVFMTNPAPICVLDEVDAPLDDANVDRFCTLLDDMAKSGSTRFLVITHHRMTMARMDRLYGVTMSERGVSQLVSVDLRKAEELRQTA